MFTIRFPASVPAIHPLSPNPPRASNGQLATHPKPVSHQLPRRSGFCRSCCLVKVFGRRRKNQLRHHQQAAHRSKALATASRIPNRGGCSPISNRIRDTRPMVRPDSSAACQGSPAPSPRTQVTKSTVQTPEHMTMASRQHVHGMQSTRTKKHPLRPRQASSANSSRSRCLGIRRHQVNPARSLCYPALGGISRHSVNWTLRHSC